VKIRDWSEDQPCSFCLPFTYHFIYIFLNFYRIKVSHLINKESHFSIISNDTPPPHTHTPLLKYLGYAKKYFSYERFDVCVITAVL
jgi:hypothetical protein